MVEAVLTFTSYLSEMAFESGSFDITLAAAAGNDRAFLAELRRDYSESVDNQIDLLARSRCDGNWTMAASRLRSLAASFHDDRLMTLAQEALSSAPGEPTVLRALTEHSAEIGGQGG